MKQRNEDWGKFFGVSGPRSNKETLIEECRRLGIPVHVDDVSENTSEVYSELRAVASEQELHSRLSQYKSLKEARHSKIISLLALLISVAALITSIVTNLGE